MSLVVVLVIECLSLVKNVAIIKVIGNIRLSINVHGFVPATELELHKLKGKASAMLT